MALRIVKRGETITLVCDWADKAGEGDDPTVSRVIRITSPSPENERIVTDAAMVYDDVVGRWIYKHKPLDGATPGRWKFEAIGTDGGTPNVIMGQGFFGVSRRVGGYVKPVPNVLYWPIVGSSDHDTVTAIWEQYLEFGANSLPMCNHSTTPRSVLTVQGDDAWVDNFLTVQGELGNYPIQMEVSFGHHSNWSGNDAYVFATHELVPQIWRRRAETMLEAAHEEVYHTTIVDAIGAGDLKTLLDANMAALGLDAGDYTAAVQYLHCPGFYGTTYLAAIAKLEEAVKWFSTNVPVTAVHFDSEIFTNANFGSSRTAIAAGIADTPHTGLEGCTRCLSDAGFNTNKNTLGTDLAASVRTYAADALICQFHVFDIGTAERNAAPYWELGSASNFTVPMYSIYEVTRDSVGGLITTGKATVARYEELIAAGQVASGHQYWIGAPLGSYVYITQRLDPSDYTRGYMTYEQMYKICLHMASKGVAGFAMWPGYSGRDKNPATYIPGTASYPAQMVADDAAALIVYPAMHQAIIDWAS